MAGLSGRKVRSLDQLNDALAGLESRPAALPPQPSDHETDVLIAAAALRKIAPEVRYWQPQGLTQEIRRTEGWTFGVS